MEFTEQKDLILTNIEHGDRAKIAKLANVSEPTLRSALRKCCVSDMSAVERKAWESSLIFVSRKIKKREQIEQKTLEVAEKL